MRPHEYLLLALAVLLVAGRLASGPHPSAAAKAPSFHGHMFNLSGHARNATLWQDEDLPH